MGAIRETHTNGGVGRRWLVSAALSAALIALTLLVCKATFLNNDDTNILYALAGYRTGTPYPTHRFVNMLLGLLIHALYGVLPGAPWWTIWLLSMLLLSLTVICASIRKASDRAGLPAWTAYALFLLLYVTAYIYAVYTVSFTLTAGLLGASGAALLLAVDPIADTRAARCGAYIGGAALLLLGFLTRNSSGICMACFYGAAIFYRLFRVWRDKRAAARLIVYTLCVGLLCAGAMAVNALGVRLYNPPEYAAFESARGHFIDYPHATYEEDPAFFSDLGWDETVYDLADNLCFLDENVTAGSMEAAARHTFGTTPGVLRGLLDAVRSGERFFRGSGIAQYLLAIPVALFLLLLLLWRRRREDGAALWTAVLTAAGAFALCFYLCYTGRFPVRTFQLIALATVSLLAVLCATCWSTPKKRGVPYWAAAAVLAALVAWGGVQTVFAALSYDKRATVETNAAAERYAIAHSENVYLTDVTSLENLSLWTTYPAQKPTNLVDWGGTAMHSGWKTEQIEKNGLTPFNGSVFRRENVYFITEEDGDKLGILTAYLALHEGASGAEKVDTITDGVAVYRFLFGKEPAR